MYIAKLKQELPAGTCAHSWLPQVFLWSLGFDNLKWKLECSLLSFLGLTATTENSIRSSEEDTFLYSKSKNSISIPYQGGNNLLELRRTSYISCFRIRCCKNSFRRTTEPWRTITRRRLELSEQVQLWELLHRSITLVPFSNLVRPLYKWRILLILGQEFISQPRIMPRGQRWLCVCILVACELIGAELFTGVVKSHLRPVWGKLLCVYYAYWGR
jgi:hypothetical protein